MREHQPPDLMHKVTLAGAREEDYFMLYIASGKEDSDVELQRCVYFTIHVHAYVINLLIIYIKTVLFSCRFRILPST